MSEEELAPDPPMPEGRDESRPGSSARLRRSDASTTKKVVAGILALLLVVTFASSLLGGTRETRGTTTTTTGPSSTTSTTATREQIVAAGVDLAAALVPLPAGDVVRIEDAGLGEPGEIVDPNAPEAAVVDLVAVGWYDRDADHRYAFFVTRGGPPQDLEGCLRELAVYGEREPNGTLAPAWQGEANLGTGPCAAHGAFEKGRLAGNLLPSGALWIIELSPVPGGPAPTGEVVAELIEPGGSRLRDAAAVQLQGTPVPAEMAEAFLALANFRAAQPPDGPVATP